jgi:hypothetical protein
VAPRSNGNARCTTGLPAAKWDTAIPFGLVVLAVFAGLAAAPPALGAAPPALCPQTATPAPCSPQFGVSGLPHWDQIEDPNVGLYHDMAGEPGLGVLWANDHLMMQARKDTYRIACTDPVDPSTMAATCAWQDVSMPASCQQPTDDFVLVTEPNSGRTWAGGLLAPNTLVCYTDDEGATWHGPASISGAVAHEGLGVGPWAAAGNPVPPPVGAGYALYHCTPDQNAAIFCNLSNDGGSSFGPPMPVPPCTNAHGKPRVAPDGHLFVPIGACASGSGYFYSKDQGQTWGAGSVPGSPFAAGGFDPSLAFSRGGWMYYAKPEVPGSGIWVAMTPDEGASWAQMGGANAGLPATCWSGSAAYPNAYFNLGCLVDPGRAVFGSFTSVMAGDDARAAVAFLAAVDTNINYNPSDGYFCSANFPWQIYVAMTYDGGVTWTLEQGTPNPVQIGGMWSGGGLQTCHNLLDSMDLNMDHTGRLTLAFAKGCADVPLMAATACATSADSYVHAWATLLRQRTGCGLFSQYDQPGTAIDCPVPPIPPLPAALACAPGTQTVAINVAASLAASGGSGGSYAWSAPGASPNLGTGASFAPTYSTLGTATVTLSRGTESVDCKVTVATAPGPATNHPPVMQPIPSRTVMVGTSSSVQIVASDPDAGDTLTYTATNLPPGCSLGAASGTLTCSISVAGTYCYTAIRVTDNHGASTSGPLCLYAGQSSPDSDRDGLPDLQDNCVGVSNNDQADADHDGAGDACDPTPCAYDAQKSAAALPRVAIDCGHANAAAKVTVVQAAQDKDRDGVPDLQDNCPAASNHGQADLDADGLGDACDPDVDSDGIANGLDNCPRDYNPDQADANGDGTGDACGAATLAALPARPGAGAFGNVQKSRDDPAASSALPSPVGVVAAGVGLTVIAIASVSAMRRVRKTARDKGYVASL